MQSDYLNVLEAFKKANINELNRICDLKRPLIIASITFLLMSILMFSMNQAYGTAIIIVFSLIYSLYLFRTIKNANKKIAQYFNLKVEFFLLINQDYWRGARALLFFKSLSEAYIKTISNDLITLIEKEQSYKELKILDMPFQIAGFAILGISLEKLLDKLDQSALIVSISIAIIVILFILIHAYIVLTFRTEKSKTNDLLLFISWYNNFGNTLFSSDK